MHFRHWTYCILFGFIMMSCSEKENELPGSDDTVSVTFMVMNRTGHNGPGSMDCGGEPVDVEFTFITPALSHIQVISGDTQEFIGLQIVEGQRLTVVVNDPVTEEELVSKSTLFNPTVNQLPEGAHPIIRLCPKTVLEFRYF